MDIIDWIEGEIYKCIVFYLDLFREVVRFIVKVFGELRVEGRWAGFSVEIGLILCLFVGKRLFFEVYVFLSFEED